jgi:predicted MFS family arabinose efflux permease
MLSPKQTAAVFTLEGINSFATTLYFYYLYFFTERAFGFTKFQNLLLAAAMGLSYAMASALGGRFAQRRGYLTALKCGYAIMALTMGAAVFVNALPIHFLIMFTAYAGAALTWPALEALVCEGQARGAVQRNLGIYNLVWGGTGAIAYFFGGAIIEAGTFRALFAVSALLSAGQFFFVLALDRAMKRRSRHNEMAQRAAGLQPTASAISENTSVDHKPAAGSPVTPQTFLRMAWLANPFAYLAINTVVAVIPSLAQRLELNVVQAGIFCSIWLFVRTGSFLLMWLWPGWHYRFRWLLTAYAALALSFVILLVSGNLWTVIAAQIAFGLALGLIYCSSLYYSMDVGTEAKGEHGGWHEAMIGVGSFAGPAIGAAGMYFFPRALNSSTWAAAGLLAVGFAGLCWLRWRRT